MRTNSLDTLWGENRVRRGVQRRRAADPIRPARRAMACTGRRPRSGSSRTVAVYSRGHSGEFYRGGRPGVSGGFCRICRWDPKSAVEWAAQTKRSLLRSGAETFQPPGSETLSGKSGHEHVRTSSWRSANRGRSRMRIQQVRSVRATRKPMSSWLRYRLSVWGATRYAERRESEELFQEPPRMTRQLQSPLVQAEPSLGASR